ncbi:uncharacterized protein LOC114009726 [Tupaia chinensis]|uniref:uncharacterized protein LOC114009726 n=1 Tax=Tupaia chinensis TaxID=246437 RepID=UPI000FFBE2BC|nr:uncharacterized protein LOC114009726 [Tupaia chinensis]
MELALSHSAHTGFHHRSGGLECWEEACKGHGGGRARVEIGKNRSAAISAWVCTSAPGDGAGRGGGHVTTFYLASGGVWGEVEEGCGMAHNSERVWKVVRCTFKEWKRGRNATPRPVKTNNRPGRWSFSRRLLLPADTGRAPLRSQRECRRVRCRDQLKMETAAPARRKGFCSRSLKEKVKPAFLPDKQQQHNKNPEGVEGVMSQSRARRVTKGVPLPLRSARSGREGGERVRERGREKRSSAGPWGSFVGDQLKMETAAPARRKGFCSRSLKEKVKPAFLPDKQQQHNKNPEGVEGVMSQSRARRVTKGVPLPLRSARSGREGLPKLRVAKLETFPL